MNEGFIIRLRRNGRRWPINSLGPDGIVLDNETDAFPRQVSLEFDARGASTAYRIDRVRQLKGWKEWQFDLNVSLANGALSVKGVDENSLPAGLYWIRLAVSGAKITGGRLQLEIEENQTDALLNVDVQPDRRGITLTRELDQFDEAIHTVLAAADSRLDGLPIVEWLQSGARASRKACLLNLMAKLRTAPTPKEAPLIDLVDSVFFAGTERVYGQVKPELYTRLRALAADKKRPFYYEGNPQSPTHLKLLERMAEHGWGAAGNYTLHSFRQESRPSMQVVIAAPSVSPAPFCGDFDIDLGNPRQDVEGFVIHMGELIFASDTDHLKLRKDLYKGATKEFIYYKVV